MISQNSIKPFAASFVLAFSLATGWPAQAAWLFSQGNVGVIENPADCTYKHMGWGLDLQQNPGFSNWVHLTVPTKREGTLGTRYIRLQFYTGSADAYVSEIHVYSGATKVKEFTNLTYSDGWKEVQLDLGSEITFIHGIGISIKIVAGVQPMSHQFIFSSAGANFLPARNRNRLRLR